MATKPDLDRFVHLMLRNVSKKNYCNQYSKSQRSPGVQLTWLVKWAHAKSVLACGTIQYITEKCVGGFLALCFVVFKWTPIKGFAGLTWRHQMETFSALLALCRRIHQSPVNSSHKGQWRGALMFSLICAWINGWVNNREAGDLRRHRTHYDVIVMIYLYTSRSLHWRWVNRCEATLKDMSKISLYPNTSKHNKASGMAQSPTTAPEPVTNISLCDECFVNSLWPSDAIWQHRSGSTLVQVMAWCRQTYHR